jgi:hypothetical protein
LVRTWPKLEVRRLAINTSAPILIEIEPKAGVKTVAIRPESLSEESAKAIDSVMNTIYNTATRINTTIEALAVKPSEVEVNFGIKAVAETGAIIAKASGEANFGVKITWKCGC